jgi:hypothetical protein
MNDALYNEWISGLDADTRELVQKIMARVGAIVNSDRRQTLDDIQRVERRQATNSGRIAELNLRLDQYEDHQWTAAKEAIEQFAATQLPPAERDRLIGVLFEIGRDVSALKIEVARLKERQAGGDGE